MLTVKQAAAIIGVTEARIYQLLDNLNAEIIDDHWRIPLEDVQRYADKDRRPGPPAKPKD